MQNTSLIADRIADLSAAWAKADALFPYFPQLDFDFDAWYRECLEQLLQTDSEKDFHLLMAAFLNRLGDGHTGYLLPRSFRDSAGRLPFSLRWDRGLYRIHGTTEGLRRFQGSEAVSVNDQPLAELIQSLFPYVYHIGPFVPSWALSAMLPLLLKPEDNILRTDDDALVFDLLHAEPKLEVPAPWYGGEDVSAGKLPMRLNNGTLTIHFPDFLYPEAAAEVKEALSRRPLPDKVALDISDCVGGMTLYAQQVAELFIPGVFRTFRKWTRQHRADDEASASQFALWTPERLEDALRSGLCTREDVEGSRKYLRRAAYETWENTYGTPEAQALYTGPLEVLISRNTVSAAEDFAAMFRLSGRAPLVGEATCGATGTPYFRQLRTGGRFRIVSIGCELCDGTPFSGRGIEPTVNP